MKLNQLLALGLACTSVSLLFAADEPKSHRIEQKNREFSIAEITVKPGEQIEFCNLDDVTHNVFSKSAVNAFNLKTQKPGSTSTVEFKDVGTTEIRCAIHPAMKLIVHVKN
jgi:plastocyanin